MKIKFMLVGNSQNGWRLNKFAKNVSFENITLVNLFRNASLNSIDGNHASDAFDNKNRIYSGFLDLKTIL